MPELHRPHRILVVDTDPALTELLRVWLAGEAEVVAQHGATTAPRVDLLVVDVPFPRQAAPQVLHDLAQAHPGTPVLAVSSTFFGGVASHGAVARSLGVAAVLPKPVTREALLGAVRDLLARAS